MTEDERKNLGLTKQLRYRYALSSGDFNLLEEKQNTNYLRALARLGVYIPFGDGVNEKYFKPDTVEAIKQQKDASIPTTYTNPIYISDFEVPMKYVQKTVVYTGGPIYDKNDVQIGYEPDVVEETVKREAETRITPPDVQLGLEGAGTYQDTPQEDIPDKVESPEDKEAKGDDPAPDVTEEERKETVNTSSVLEKLNLLRGIEIVNGKEKKLKGTPPISTNANPKINEDGTVDFDKDVTINVPNSKNKVKLLENGKFTIKFGKITGNFICTGMKKELTSLEGGPKVVTGTYEITDSDITSLAGSPEEVGIFICRANRKLTSLAGGPKKINGITDSSKSAKVMIYTASDCSLTSLENNGITYFGPGGFDCSVNKIQSLSGLSVVDAAGVTQFNCSKNLITSLVGAPKPIKDSKTGKPGDYNISDNPDITVFTQTFANFEVDTFRANGLKLSSLSFAPKQVYGDFECKNNRGDKITNEYIGKKRFKVAGGYEEDAGNRIVKIDGNFITNEGAWKDKTYDINTVFKAAPKPETASGTGTGGSIGKVPSLPLSATQSDIDAWMKKIFVDAGPGLHRAQNLTMSYTGAVFVVGAEGKEKYLYDDKAKAPVGKYPQKWEDFNGNPTIGIGNLVISKGTLTAANIANPTPAMQKWQAYMKPPAGNLSWTLAEMYTEKVKDTLGFINSMKKRFSNDAKCTQTMFDAVMSLAFNTGPNRSEATCGGPGGPVGIAKEINNGNYAKAAQMLKTHSDCQTGNVKNGLIARRQREYELFIKNGYVT